MQPGPDVLSITFCGAVVSVKVMDQNFNNTRQQAHKKLSGAYNCVYINTWRVCQTRVHKSLIGNVIARHSFSLFDRNNTQPQTSKTSEQRLAYHWRNDGRLQKFADNQILC